MLKKMRIAHELALQSKQEQGKIVNGAISAVDAAVEESKIVEAERRPRLRKRDFGS